MGKVTCAVIGCSNSTYRLNKWKDKKCVSHGVYHGQSLCTCPPPFEFFPFPKRADHLSAWIVNINRLEARDRTVQIRTKTKNRITHRKKGDLWRPVEYDRVCSDHFVDGRPTEENPNPTLSMGYEDLRLKQRVKKYTSNINESTAKSTQIVIMESRDECCVPGCHTNRKTAAKRIRFYTFPLEKERRTKWLQNILNHKGALTGNTALLHQVQQRNLFVCSKHFVKRAMSNDENDVDYVPTVFDDGLPEELGRDSQAARDRDTVLDELQFMLEMSGHYGFIAFIPVLQELLDDFVRSQTGNRFGLSMTFTRVEDEDENSEAVDNESNPSIMFINHLCSDYNGFRLEESPVPEDMEAPADPQIILTDESLIIKEEPVGEVEASPALPEEIQNLESGAYPQARRVESTARKRKRKGGGDIGKGGDGNGSDTDSVDDQGYVKTVRKALEDEAQREKERSALWGFDPDKEKKQMRAFNTSFGDSSDSEAASDVDGDAKYVQPSGSDSDEEVLESDTSPQLKTTQTNEDSRKSENNPNDLDPTEDHTYNKRKSLSCDFCDFKTQFKFSLIRHNMAKHGDPNDRKYLCKICFQILQSSEALEAHVARVHKDEKEACSECGKLYQNRATLRMHMKVKHSDVSSGKYECPICRKRFHQKHHFEGHVDSHDGTKRHQCKRCGHSYSYASSLTKHQCKPAKKETPKYPCEQCGLTFAKKSYLNEHMIGKHSGTAPYVCKHCSMSFTWRGSYANHKYWCKVKKVPHVVKPMKPVALKSGSTSIALVHLDNNKTQEIFVTVNPFQNKDYTKAPINTTQSNEKPYLPPLPDEQEFPYKNSSMTSGEQKSLPTLNQISAESLFGEGSDISSQKMVSILAPDALSNLPKGQASKDVILRTMKIKEEPSTLTQL